MARRTLRRRKTRKRRQRAGSTPKEDVGIIVMRCVREPKHNIIFRECYTAIRKFHPTLKIIFIDDNSDKSVLEEDPTMQNIEIIQSEYPAAGEYLPYWYMLQRKLYKKAIFIQDSMILNAPIPYEAVNDFMFLYEFPNEAGHYTGEQEKWISTLLGATKEPEALMQCYMEKKWKGCWGSMMVITSDFLNQVEEKLGISKWNTIINSRIHRISLESAIGICCSFIQPNKESVSLFGPISDMHIMKDPGNEKYTFDMYMRNKPVNKPRNDIIKIWSGR